MFRIQTLNGVTINESQNANISLPQRRGSAFEAAERDRIMARERMRRLRQKRKEEGLTCFDIYLILTPLWCMFETCEEHRY